MGFETFRVRQALRWVTQDMILNSPRSHPARSVVPPAALANDRSSAEAAAD